MAGPWEEYQEQGPWTEYQQATPPKPTTKQRTAGQQARHDLSYGTRGVVEGLAGAADIVVDPLATGLEHLTGHPMYRGHDLGRMAADAMGLDHPETSGERVISDINRAGAGVVNLAGAARAIPRAAGPVGQAVKTMFGAQPGMQMTGAATGAGAASAVRENGGSERAQMGVGLVGSVLPGVGAYGAVGGARRLARGAARDDIYTAGELAAMGFQKGEVDEASLQQLIAFQRAGIRNPSVGQVGQTRFMQAAESGLANFPGSAGVMAGHAQGQIDDATRVIDGITRGAGPTSAGRAIDEGTKQFGNRLEAASERVYAPVHRAMDGQSVQIDNTLSTLRAATNPVPSTPATSAQLGNKKLGNVLDALLTDSRHASVFPGIAPTRTIPFEGLKAQRSQIGELIGDSYTRDVGASADQLSSAYGAMSRDMEQGAAAVGPHAANALSRANRVHATGMGRQQALRSTVGDGVPEDIYRRATASIREGGTELGVIMKSLGPEQRREVSRAVIRDLGWVPKGQQGARTETFSAVTFKNNWADLSPEAKKALFDHLPPAERQQLQAMADVGENIQQGSKVFANPSGTAGKSALYSLITGAPAASVATGNVLPMLGALAAPVAANGIARLVTSPRAANWAVGRTTKPYGIFAPATQTTQRKKDKRP